MSVHPLRPPTVQCVDWEPVNGATEGSMKRCRLYVDPVGEGKPGGCQMARRLVCEEWERKFGHTFRPTEVPAELRAEQERNKRRLPFASDKNPRVDSRKWPVKILVRAPATDAKRSGQILGCAICDGDDERNCRICAGACPDGEAANFMPHAPTCDMCQSNLSTRVVAVNNGRYVNVCDSMRCLPRDLASTSKKLVVHCKKESFDVYVGRPGPWGNPFSHVADSQAKEIVPTREEAIRRYEAWVIEQGPTFIEKIRRELHGKVLGCWCDPEPCHGHVLARMANAMEIGMGLVPTVDPSGAPPAVDLLATPAQARANAPPPPTTGFLTAPEPKKLRAKDVARATMEAMAPVPKEFRDSVPENPIATLTTSILDEESLRAIEETGAEITICGPFGEVTLVKAPTGRPRREMTYRAVAVLRWIAEIFPDTVVTKFARPNLDEKKAEDEAEDPMLVLTNDTNVCGACGCKSPWSLFEKPCTRCGASKVLTKAQVVISQEPSDDGWDS